ncbi:MAG TPA: hypothetical protein VGV59_19245 [Pyrinomonadaceae bacterium]|nr:hypothetical protein [Pyrinomonadaceae bacterium]
MTLQLAIFIIGALFAIVGIALFIKGVGRDNPGSIKAAGIELNGVAPALVIFVVGGALIYVSAQMQGNLFGQSQQTPTPTPVASKGGETPQPDARAKQPRIMISPPADDTIAAEDLRRDGENWLFRVKGTSEGLHDAQGKVYLLYRDLSWQGWEIEDPIAIPPDGKWEAEAWADVQTVGTSRRHRCQLRAVATPDTFAPGSFISLDFKTVKPPDAAETDAGRPFRHTALSEAVELTLEIPN